MDYLHEIFELQRKRPRYKLLYEKKVRELKRLYESNFQVISKYHDENCEHSLDDWEITSDGGFAFYIFKCKCGLEIAQSAGERVKPENLPKDLHRNNSWSE